MIGQSIDTVAEPRPAPLDERVLGSPTTWRFILLLVLFVAGAAGLSLGIAADLTTSSVNNSVGCAVASGLNPEAGLHAGWTGSIMGDWPALEACWAHYVPNVGWVPLVVVPTLLLAAAVLYLILPRWKGRRSRFAVMDQVDIDGRLRHDLDALVAEAGLRVRVRFGVDPHAVTAGAVVFGTRRRPAVCLHGGLLVMHRTDPERFRAVVLHELAHVRNGDVAVTYATVAMWRVFLAAVLLPAAGNAVYGLFISRFPAAWHMSSLQVYTLIVEALIVVMVYLARADILRIREMHADLTAVRRWQVRPDELVTERVPSARSDTAWSRARAAIRELWRTHPSWAARRRALDAPDALFRLGALPMFSTGLIADVFVGQVNSSIINGSTTVGTLLDLLTAGLIIAIGGVTVWRAVLYALAHDRTAPSGWLAGFWLGTGLSVGELANRGATGSGWLPPHPETLLILIVIVMLLLAWTAQYAQLRIQTHRGRSLPAAMLIGLTPPWLVLTFVLSWWKSLTPLEGWLISGTDLVNSYGLPTDRPPPLLIRIDTVIAVLPGGETTFAGLWWALPLLWLLPLALWARRRFDRMPRWLNRMTPEDRPVAAALPSLRPIMRAGLLGGLAAGVGLLTARVGVDTVRGLGHPVADSAAEFVWIVLVITAAMLITAAVVSATSSAYPLLAALIAAGVVALVGTLVAGLQFSFDGCLGPADVLVTDRCVVRPTVSADVFLLSGYVLSAATLASLGAAALTRAARGLPWWRRADPPVGIADAARRSRHRWAAAVLVVTVAVIATDTIRAANPVQVSAAWTAHVFRPSPAPSAQTESLQIWGWSNYGGLDLIHRIHTMGATMPALITKLADAANTDLRSTEDHVIPPVCAQLAALTSDADNYFPVPVAQGQEIWADLVGSLHSAATACHRTERAHDLESFAAMSDDLLNAEVQLTTFLGWIGLQGTLGGHPIVAVFGQFLPLVYHGITYQFSAANLSIHPAGADRVATLDVTACVAGLPPNTVLVGGHPSAQPWRLVFPDGTRVAPVRTWSPRDFDASPYPPISQGDFSNVGDCVGGLVPFDIPAAEQGMPRQVLFTPTATPATLAWNPHTPSATTGILGTPKPVTGGAPGDWMAVTGYSVRTAGRNDNPVPPGDRIATISTVACTSNIPATTAAPWSLLLSDGVTASPIRSGTASDTEPPPSRDGSANIGSHDNCRSGSIAFDIRAADKADPVEIGYNSASTSLSWRMTPPPQS